MNEFLEALKTYAGVGIAIGGGFAAFIVALIGWRNQLQPTEGDLTVLTLEQRLVSFRAEIYTEINRRCEELNTKCNNIRDELKGDVNELEKELRYYHNRQ